MANKRRFALLGAAIGKVDQTDAPVDGDLLRYNGTNERWEFVNLSALSGVNADTLDSLDSLDFARLASTGTISAVWTFSTGPVLQNNVDISWTNTDDTIVGLLNMTGGQAGDIYFSNVQLLADWDGADAATTFTEESSNAAVATFAGTAQLDTAQFKFGTASLLLDGNSDYVTFPDIAGYTLGASDFTIECWVRFNALPSASSENGAAVLAHWTNTGNQRAWVLAFNTSDQLKFQFSTDGTTSTTRTSTDAPTLATGQWYHVAATRSGTTLRLFIDGVQLTLDSATISGTLFNSTDTLRVGAINTTAGNRAFVDGWLDDLRLTVGTARYTAGFTVPSTAFSASAQVDSWLEIGDANYDTYVASTLYVRGGKQLRIYDSTNTDYSAIYDNGSGSYFETNNNVYGFLPQGVLAFTITSTFASVPGGKAFRVYDAANTDYGAQSHDGTDYNWTFTNTTDLNISGITDLNLTANLVLGTSNHIFKSVATGGLTVSGGSSASNGANIELYGGSHATLANQAFVDADTLTLRSQAGTERFILNSTAAQVRGGLPFRVYDSGNTDYGDQSHDGTDYTWAFTNTTDLNITGVTYIDLSGRIKSRSTGSHLSLYDTDDADTADYTLVERNGGNLNLYHYDAGTATFTLVLRGAREGATTLYYNGASRIIAGTAGLELPNATTSTTVGAAGAASALPANPTGYLSVVISGTTRKIPYYAT